MILFFIILAILFFLSSFVLLLCLSDLEIEINKLHFDSNNKKEHKLEDYLFYIRLKILDKITWLKIEIDKNKIKTIENSKLFKSNFLSKINEYDKIIEIILNNKEEIFKKSNTEYIKELNICIKKLDLYLELCISNSTFTSFLVATIASIISIILARNIKKYDRNKYNYIIMPKYEYKSSIKLKLNCIINIKVVHIINVLCMLIKKRREKYDERTSNRRSYASINE